MELRGCTVIVAVKDLLLTNFQSRSILFGLGSKGTALNKSSYLLRVVNNVGVGVPRS